eukprot:1677921-Alexandrium_andersonii.AAC.1
MPKMRSFIQEHVSEGNDRIMAGVTRMVSDLDRAFNTRLDQHEHTLTEHDGRLQRLEQENASMRESIEKIRNELALAPEKTPGIPVVRAVDNYDRLADPTVLRVSVRHITKM